MAPTLKPDATAGNQRVVDHMTEGRSPETRLEPASLNVAGASPEAGFVELSLSLR